MNKNIFNALIVNVSMFYLIKYSSGSLFKYIKHQISTISIFIIVAVVCNLIADILFQNHIVKLLIIGIIYVSICFYIIYMIPSLIAMPKNDMVDIKKKIISKFFKSLNKLNIF